MISTRRKTQVTLSSWLLSDSKLNEIDTFKRSIFKIFLSNFCFHSLLDNQKKSRTKCCETFDCIVVYNTRHNIILFDAYNVSRIIIVIV